MIPLIGRKVLHSPCTIEIEHTERSLHAHVDLDSGIALRPGDRVRVLGEPVQVRFGQKLVLRRQAAIERAGWMERQWTRLIARFDLAELYEVSFTPGRLS